jgi:hypothetical protein
MTAPTLTPEETAGWFAVFAARLGRADGRQHMAHERNVAECAMWADAAVQAYRERRAPPDVSPPGSDVEGLREAIDSMTPEQRDLAASGLARVIDEHEADRADEEPSGAPGASEPLCTGVAAQWCPGCGECSCPTVPESDWRRTLNDPACPLHSVLSKHAEPSPPAEEPDTSGAPSHDMTDQERELWHRVVAHNAFKKDRHRIAHEAVRASRNPFEPGGLDDVDATAIAGEYPEAKLDALTRAVEAQLTADEQTAEGAGARASEAHARIRRLRAALDAAGPSTRDIAANLLEQAEPFRDNLSAYSRHANRHFHAAGYCQACLDMLEGKTTPSLGGSR